MRARQTQHATQIVKINLAGPKRRRRAQKKKPVVRTLHAPDSFRSENVAPIPFFGRMGPQVEPLRVQRAEEPRQLRIEDFRENFVPPPAFRQYLATLIDQPKTMMRIEEVPEERLEAPPPPLVSGPLSGMGSAAASASSTTSSSSAAGSKKPQVVFEPEDLSSWELFAMRDRGEITKGFLSELPITSKAQGLTLFKVASRLGLVVPGAIQRGGKGKFIDWILENM